MKKLIENHWKELAIVFVYILVACLAYGVWFNSLWHKWYINFDGQMHENPLSHKTYKCRCQ